MCTILWLDDESESVSYEQEIEIPDRFPKIDIEIKSYEKIDELLEYIMSAKDIDCNVIFIIDSTWACSTSLLKKSKNLQNLNYISFDNIKESEYKIKEQPANFCLSTIESTLCVLELLNKYNIEEVLDSN